MVTGTSLGGRTGCRAGSPFSAVAFVKEPQGRMTDKFALRPRRFLPMRVATRSEFLVFVDWCDPGDRIMAER
jgi:hypothetical protein